MTAAIRLSDARIGDLGAIIRVMDAAFDPAFGEAWSGAQVLTLLAMPSARIRVAWDGDQACGFAAARLAGPESELLLLAVAPAARRRGIGSLLLEDWIEWARGQGALEFFLEMRADNNAFDLYRHFGFVECGRRPEYYHGADSVARDAITMRMS